MLFFQAQTMQMMYDIIAEELKASELLHAHPQDYLNFYCLGNREWCNEEGSTSGSNRSSSGNSVMRQFFICIHILLFCRIWSLSLLTVHVTKDKTKKVFYIVLSCRSRLHIKMDGS